MNSDSIEIGAPESAQDEVVTRLRSAFDVELRAEEWGWWAPVPGYNHTHIEFAATPQMIGYTDWLSWYVEVRCSLSLRTRRVVAQRLWDALAEGTDWHLLWDSDDEEGDGIVAERRSRGGLDIPSFDEQAAVSEAYLQAHPEQRRIVLVVNNSRHGKLDQHYMTVRAFAEMLLNLVGPGDESAAEAIATENEVLAVRMLIGAAVRGRQFVPPPMLDAVQQLIDRDVFATGELVSLTADLATLRAESQTS